MSRWSLDDRRLSGKLAGRCPKAVLIVYGVYIKGVKRNVKDV